MSPRAHEHVGSVVRTVRISAPTIVRVPAAAAEDRRAADHDRGDGRQQVRIHEPARGAADHAGAEAGNARQDRGDQVENDED